jgi:hypothetical protein
MTIPNLTVNLSGVFEYGQAYVGELEQCIDNEQCMLHHYLRSQIQMTITIV